MAKQLIYVDDQNIGATGDAALIYDSSATTLTTTNDIVAVGLTLTGTITGNSSTDIAINTDAFTLDAGTKAATFGGTMTIADDVTLAGTLYSGAEGDIDINTGMFTVDATQGNTLIAGNCGISGTLDANLGLEGGASADITLNTNKFTVDATNGNTLIAGTLAVTGNTTLTGTLVGGSGTDIAINTDAFTLDGGTKAATFGGTVGIAGHVTLGAGADLLGSSTSDIDIDSVFTVAGASGNTLVGGTLDVTGVVTHAVEVAQPIVNVAATSGAVTLAVDKKLTTYVTNSSGAITASLADGETGQELIVILYTKDTNAVVITPANMANGTEVTLDATAARVHFIFDGTDWHVVSTTGTIS